MVKRILTMTLCLAMFMLIIFPVCVSAAESNTDFSDVDWSTVDWHTIDLVEWLNWLDEAELNTLFQMAQRCDGASAEGLANVLGSHFKKDPVGLIMALSAEKEEIQTRVISLIVYNGDYHHAEFEQFMNGLTLPEDAGAGAVNILVQMVQRAEENWGMDITNPHTGDPVGFAALLMLASGLGGALLWKKRRIAE